MSDWQSSISTPQLVPGEIHVWRINLAIPGYGWQSLTTLLTDDERAKAQRFHFERHRRRQVVGRAALRTLLGDYLQCPPQSIGFAYNSHGKPRLAEDGVGLSFNLSHTQEVMLAAFVLNSEIGIDIESVQRDVDCMEIGQRWFSQLESRSLRALPENARRDAFFRAWSRKEAYIKARGEGISHPLQRFSVSLDTSEPRLIEHLDDARETQRWRTIDIDAGNEYRAAVVVETADWALSLHRLARPPFTT